MDGSQQFRLKWNNYHVNIANSFDSLRLDEDFVDVTVACDGFQTKAHRMVLSACSPYFRDLLKSNPHPHPIVILRDVGRRHLQLLLDYMYHGEVNVAQAQLADFLKVAELLKVKGLADDRPPEEATAADTNGRPGSESPASTGAAPPGKRRRTSPPAVRALKQERSPEPEPYTEPEPCTEPEATPEPEPEQNDGLPERLQDGLADSPPTDLSTGQPSGPGPSAVLSYDTGQDSPLPPDPVTRLMSCPHCTHLSNNYGKLKAHIGKVHFPVPVSCAECGKVCKNKYAMQVHKSKYHRRTWKSTGGGPPVPLERSPPAWSPRPGSGQGSPLLHGQGQGSPRLPGQGQGSPLLPGQAQGSPLLHGRGQGSPLLHGPSHGLTQGSPLLAGSGQESPLLPGQGQGPLLPIRDCPSPAAGLDLTRKQGLTSGPDQMQ